MKILGRNMKKKIAVLLVGALLGTTLAGCSKANSPQEGSGGVVELIIPHYKAGQNTGAKLFEPQVERFNEKYKDEYKIVIEQIPQESYSEKIKQLAQQEELPALIEGGDPEWLEKYVIPNKKYFDLSAWLDEKPEVKNVLIGDSLDFATRDGHVVGLPLAISKPVGLYYNHTMLETSKQIKDMNVDEFLNELGDQKIALQTAGNGWTTLLFLTALIANEPGGVEMLKDGVINKVVDYNTPIWINAVTQLQEIAQNNAAPNSIGAASADADNNFMSKNASILATGPWKIADFSDEGVDKWSNGFDGTQVSANIYPGNIAVDNVLTYTWWVPDNVSENEKEAALAFLEFIYSPEELEIQMLTEGGVAPNYTPSGGFLDEQKENRILYELNSAIDSETTIVPSTEIVMPSSVAAQEFGKLLPKLFDGSFTPEEFCDELTKKAEQAIQ